MGKVVLHINKAKGNDAAMTAHIERTVDPPNVDKTRTHLNKELVEFPEGVNNRTQAIQHRIENAGITRKIRADQVRAIRIMLSGSPEDMKQIEETGKLADWSNDNMEWLYETFGKDNVVSAALHRDEKTPHIHATVVPIVTGERRKAKKEAEDTNKKKYKKKSKDTVRLCADDVVTRNKLEQYQDTYAEKMQKYGLERGIRGSEAKHITNTEYSKKLLLDVQEAKEDIIYLQQQKEEVYEKVRDMYDRKDEARDKFLDMDSHVKQKNSELVTVEAKLEKANQEYKPYKGQEELSQIHNFFPMMEEQLRIADLCKNVGLSFENTKQLLNNKTLSASSFEFYSPEHNRKFEAKDFKLKIEKEHDDPNRLRLVLNGTNILEWFKEMFKKIQKVIVPNTKPNTNRGGIKR